MARVVVDDLWCADRSARYSSRARNNCVAAGGISGSISQMMILLDLGMDHEGPGGHAAPNPTISTELRIRMDQRGKVSQHALQPHVVWFGGSFHFAADVEIALPVGQLRNRDGGIASLAQIQQACPHRSGDSMRRPYASASHGPRPTLETRTTTTHRWRPSADHRERFRQSARSGQNQRSAPATRECDQQPLRESCVPIQGIRTMLNASAPRMAPTVFAA